MQTGFKYERGGKGLIATQKTEITPEDLAEMFWELNANEQARFFNFFFEITPKKDFEIQMIAASKSNYMAKDGLVAMRIIGESIEP